MATQLFSLFSRSFLTPPESPISVSSHSSSSLLRRLPPLAAILTADFPSLCCTEQLPKVRWVLPDSYLDVKNKDYGGGPFINGQAAPYDSKYHEEWIRNNAKANSRRDVNGRRNFDRSRNFEKRENMQNGEFPNNVSASQPTGPKLSPPAPSSTPLPTTLVLACLLTTMLEYPKATIREDIRTILTDHCLRHHHTTSTAHHHLLTTLTGHHRKTTLTDHHHHQTLGEHRQSNYWGAPQPNFSRPPAQNNCGGMQPNAGGWSNNVHNNQQEWSPTGQGSLKLT
ncbi:hypothetical protein Csa_015258 [Cucumis sativus]|uniref:Uncharacterized protein n=1 Tax=Cucumis sativus TaxID=3659 RepID=A0A0A0KVH0_CUCSA|nr:hypothetical protein Csa_015258 [Cucumis sativus]